MSGQQARVAGWSAAEKAQEVRAAGRGGMLRRVLRLLGLDPRAARVAAAAGRWEAGAVGEQMTAELLACLDPSRWAVLHDRALPDSRANVDHVLVPPAGDMVVLVDSKLWSQRRGSVQRSYRGELRHGWEDREGSVRALLHERQALQKVLGVDVLAVMCVHSAPVSGGRFTLENGIVVVQADGLLEVLRQNAGTRNPLRLARLAAAAEAALPPYKERAGR